MQNIRENEHDVRKIAQDVFLIWKRLGETPLQALERLRKIEGLDPSISMTYAGRLDPLAEGELLILTGEECKNKEKYLGLDKEYKVEILLGASTDTGDVMGIINKQAKTARPCLAVSQVKDVLQRFVGKVSWSYPAFSSKTVQGKPLFLWSLEGKINEVDIPIRESEIYELELLSAPSTKLSMRELRGQVHQKINSLAPVPENIVNGKDTKRLGADFRRKEVLGSWASFFNKWTRGPLVHLDGKKEFEVITVRCKCSSGTYMRTLAKKIGEKLGTSALALSIVRTNIVM